jgi:RNA polymerase-binding transcription factor
MPTKTKSSAAKRKTKPTPSRARTVSSGKTKAASKASAPARAAKRAPVAATKARPASKPAPKSAPARAGKRPTATVKAVPASAKQPPATRIKPKASGSREQPTRVSGASPGSNVRQLPRQVAGIAPYEETQGEEYMGEPQREHFRRILLQWKRQLMAEVDRTVHHMQDEAANFPDPNDRATQESEFSLELRARDRERKLIKKIDEALASVNSGDYGYCESCGVEIGIRRLEARPTATLCIDCKTLDEIREKQTGS